jgi:OCT family organic cation transporter-like MFS transporter 4/5
MVCFEIDFRLVEIPAYLVGMFAVDALGRRLIINITLILGGLSCLVAGLVPQSNQLLVILFIGHFSNHYFVLRTDCYELIVIFSLIGKFFISMQIVTVNMLTAEVFPTASRGLTIGLCSTVGKVGGILAPVMSAIVSCIYFFALFWLVQKNFKFNYSICSSKGCQES